MLQQPFTLPSNKQYFQHQSMQFCIAGAVINENTGEIDERIKWDNRDFRDKRNGGLKKE